jgi:hypothetical protein
MVQVGDSAYPLAASSYPSSVQGWGFYIGGDTPHVWSDAEIAALPYRYRLPIYTRSDPSGSAQAQSDANAAVAWARAHSQPAGTLIQLDFETAVDAAYVDAFDAVVTAAGFKTLLYGSQSTVLANPRPSGGYNVANWDGVDDDPSWTAKQYQDTGGYDLNDFAADAPLWDIQAAAPAAPTPEVSEMATIVRVSGNASVYLLDGGVISGVDDPATLNGELNLPSITVDAGAIAQMLVDFAPTAPLLAQLLAALKGAPANPLTGTLAVSGQLNIAAPAATA